MARPRCARCARARCLCHLTLQPPLATDVELVLLQHPLEQHEVKGTARLLALSLARCQLLVGETFEPPLNSEDRVEALLYPGLGIGGLLPEGIPAAQLRLYVLDGTWRKSRLLLHRNPWLQALPRLALVSPPASAYSARRAQAGYQLSTLEAAVAALEQVEGRSFGALLDVQAGLMVALAAARTG
jgi:DTW domain-containing protein